ncbi:MAG: peptide ABC transporter substrate-binding protein [Candidatus Eremiobacteraeota bacterium]|nr:peptide ABC transporter substrate-binding protein [Candidatus Eremiobacteraeota bacterium]
MNARWFAALLLCLTIGTACTRVGGQKNGSGGRNSWTVPGHLRLGMPDEPDNLNPMFAHTSANEEADALIFAPLFRYDDRGEYYPELAMALPTYRNGGISKDSKTITVHMRKGVRWSDGAPLTARDWRFTYRAVMNPRNNTKALFGWIDIASVVLPDDYTLVIHLRRPNASFLGNLANGGTAYPPLPEHLLGKLPDINRATFNNQPISSGPWVLKKWNHGASLEFVPNTKYWRGAPKLQGISWRVIPSVDTLFAQLQTHEIDVYDGVSEDQIDRLKNIEGITISSKLVANWRHLIFNTSKPELSDVRTRLAIAEAVDWDGINKTMYHGYNVLAHSDIFPGSWAAPDIPLYRYDVADSKRLLDAAGWIVGPDGIRHKGEHAMHLTISTGTNKQANVQAEVQIQQALKNIGIDLAIRNYPVSFLFAQNGPLYTGKFYLSWSLDINAADPDNAGNWNSKFIPPHGANTAWLRDPIVDQTSDAAIQTFDRRKRKALYQKEEERLHQLVPAVFLYWANAYSAHNSDLKNYKQAPYVANNWNSWQWEI